MVDIVVNNRKFKPPARGDIPVMSLSESGSNMLLWSLVGPVAYNRQDSEALATHYEQLAKLVRSHA
jgi:hypothetical protein